MPRPVSFFDLDDTILEGSSGRMFFQWCYDKKVYNLADMLIAGASGLIYKMGLIDPLNLVNYWLQRHTGWSQEKFVELTNDWFEVSGKKAIRPKAIDEIEKRKQEGEVVMLSASTQFVCDLIGNHLGMHSVLCTRVALIENKLNGKLDGPFVYAEQKEIAARAYCEKAGVDLQECSYYGDALADRFILAAVGNVHCLNPKSTLYPLAQKAGWAIQNWSHNFR